jgi:peptidoglycan hydrolase-like protein with peptidoglycan-binding domain
MPWLGMHNAGSCRRLDFIATAFAPGVSAPSAGVSGGGPIEIGKPVGRGPLARNQADDVRTIQEALNQVALKGIAGGTIPFLKVDGIIGPKTQAAIDRFQQVQLKIFDGLIEPNKKTIVRLNQALNTVTDEDLKLKLAAALPLVAQGFGAAALNLQAAISQNALAAVATDRLNRHFLVNTQDAANQTATRINLFRAYTRFAALVTNPELLEIDINGQFDIDKNDPRFATVRVLGFFRPGEEEKGRRLDHIHLGLAFFSPKVSAEFAAFIIMHEITHFLGDADGLEIDDLGRGWFDDTFIKPLKVDQRLLNADSYAGFAHECRTGIATRPPFVKTAPGGLANRR